MKQLILLAICLFTISASRAQNASRKTGAQPARKGNQANNKTAIGGLIKDAHNHPIPGVEAFVYKPDSSIAASGFTDSMGHYETNAVMPGKYDLKIVYPSEKMAMVTGVIVKKGVTNISLKMDDPPADTLILFYELQPKKPVEKKKTAGQATAINKKK